MRMKTISKGRAHHLAGHAVAKCWVGCTPTALVVCSEGCGAGHGFGAIWHHHGVAPETLWDEVLVSLAGAWAEARAIRKSPASLLFGSASHDRTLAKQAIERLLELGYTQGHTKAWQRAERDVGHFLKLSWKGIEAVAAALQVHHRLAGYEVRTLMRMATPSCQLYKATEPFVE